MDNKFVIIGAVANADIRDGNQVFTQFLKDNVKDIEVRRIDYGPGPIMAMDWRIIMDSASLLGNIVTIAGTLWAAYEKFVIPSKKENAFIFVQIKNDEGRFVQFTIGQEHKDKDVFIKTFVNDVESITVDSNTIRIEKKSTTTIQINENKR